MPLSIEAWRSDFGAGGAKGKGEQKVLGIDFIIFDIILKQS